MDIGDWDGMVSLAGEALMATAQCERIIVP